MNCSCLSSFLVLLRCLPLSARCSHKAALSPGSLLLNQLMIMPVFTLLLAFASQGLNFT